MDWTSRCYDNWHACDCGLSNEIAPTAAARAVALNNLLAAIRPMFQAIPRRFTASFHPSHVKKRARRWRACSGR